MSVDAQILAALRNVSEDSISGAELARALGISRAAVWARIEALREIGYAIEASPHRGYRLTDSPDLLLADDLKARLGETRIIGRDIRVFQSTTSTNDHCERLGKDGAAEGIVVFAETQTHGRGRLGRQWVSPPGQGLWFSLLLRPRLAPTAASRVVIATAAALLRGLQSLGVEAAIKWPNDILLQDRKVAGILTEMNTEPDMVRWMVIGIGMDVHQKTSQFPPELRQVATSLHAATGRNWARPELAVTLLRELDRAYDEIRRHLFSPSAELWEARCTSLGRDLTVRVGDRRLRGRAEALDEDGALLLRTEHGRLERLIGGDVTVEK